MDGAAEGEGEILTKQTFQRALQNPDVRSLKCGRHGETALAHPYDTYIFLRVFGTLTGRSVLGCIEADFCNNGSFCSIFQDIQDCSFWGVFLGWK